MPPYNRYWYRNKWQRKYRRNRWNRRRRTRKYFPRNLYRRRRRVRRKFKPYYKKKKLKQLILKQWQPDKIRKCRIQGMFSLFQSGYGRYSNNYEQWRESYFPEDEPGGGGWSMFQLGLGNLYKEHEQLLNWWTHSNKGLNLVRYVGLKVKFYRQPETDYVVNYQTTYPFEATKYHFMSSHPERLLMFNKKIIVPSYKTAPHLKKHYIKKRIKPPKEFQNKWYFQSELSRFGLVMFTASACSLTDYFISPRAESNNVRFYSLNTEIFKHKDFKQQSSTTMGYYPAASYYIYGLQSDMEESDIKVKHLIYLGNTNTYTEGEPFGNSSSFGGTSYPFAKWGNPFFWQYLSGDLPVYVSQKQPTALLDTSKKEEKPEGITKMSNPIVIECTYNPFTDKGYGNTVKWLKNFALESGWNTDGDPDLTIMGFPLWILMWGFEDYTRKLQKLQHLETDYLIVINSSYITPKLPAYVPLSNSFVNGQPPYNKPQSEITLWLEKNWYPCFKYQKEPIENILMSGPAVNKQNTQIQAHMDYTFFFKWGGTPSYAEHIQDPNSQPNYPLPNNQQEGPEIENPENDPTTELYDFDIRRDYITKTAAQRIKKDSKTELSLFADGNQTGTTFSIPTKEQKKAQTQAQKKTKKTLEQQLQFFKLRRQQLRQRYYNLTKQLLKSESEKAQSE
nr:MAG: ORF1 [TTV-like mini virus]